MKIRFFGSISQTRELDLTLEGEKELLDVIRGNEVLKKNLLLNNSIRPDVLVLINGIDYRLLGGSKAKLNEGDEIVIIPINHGG